MMRKLDIIITGTGRCATGFYAKFLKSAGIPCGHETFFGPDGLEAAKEMLENHWFGLRADSSWLAAPFLDSEPLKDALIIHLVRHPRDTIDSMLRMGTMHDPTPFTEFHWFHLPEAREMGLHERLAYKYVVWNRIIEEKAEGRDYIRFPIEREPIELLADLQKRRYIDLSKIDLSELFDDRRYNSRGELGSENVRLKDLGQMKDELLEMVKRYGYEWKEETSSYILSPPIVKAIITTLDNRRNNEEQLQVLLAEAVSEIIFVDQDSEDGAGKWMDEAASQHQQVKVIHRQNNGAGPGRNAGLDAAGEFDFVLMLDGGIRPLRGGIEKMLDYLERHSDADVVGVEIADFETDREKAWRRWVEPIKAYRNTRLSHTAYALCRQRAWDGLRFSEEGPFAEPGWGADDDEMAYQWIEAGVIVHVATGIHPYRHASGSFRRLCRETGIWPNQYGSVYEKRLVWLQQNWPQHQPGLQWGEPWLTVVVEAGDVEETAKIIKYAHDRLRERKFEKPWDFWPNPYSIVAWCPDINQLFLNWAEPRRLRQHHGDTIIVDDEIIKKDRNNGATWTGDFRIWDEDNWRGAIRENAHYYGLVRDVVSCELLIDQYNILYPPQLKNTPPNVKEEINGRLHNT